MIIGIPKEIKEQENRVGGTPALTQALVQDGHKVVVQSGAGLGAGIPDGDYVAAGGQLIATGQP